MPLPIRLTAAAARLALSVTVALTASSCAVAAQPSFDPSGPCVADGRRPGAYPDLEARLPPNLDGTGPSRVDSGRNCSDRSLGTLARHGIGEVRFAGALWETGRRSGVTVAVFEAPGLTTERMAEFYEVGAREARRTDRVTAGPVEVAGVAGRRIDAYVEDSYQSIVVVDGRQPGSVVAVLVASDLGETEGREAHDALVAGAVETAAGP